MNNLKIDVIVLSFTKYSHISYIIIISIQNSHETIIIIVSLFFLCSMPLGTSYYACPQSLGYRCFFTQWFQISNIIFLPLSLPLFPCHSSLPLFPDLSSPTSLPKSLFPNLSTLTLFPCLSSPTTLPLQLSPCHDIFQIPPSHVISKECGLIMWLVFF